MIAISNEVVSLNYRLINLNNFIIACANKKLNYELLSLSKKWTFKTKVDIEKSWDQF